MGLVLQLKNTESLLLTVGDVTIRIDPKTNANLRFHVEAPREQVKITRVPKPPETMAGETS